MPTDKVYVLVFDGFADWEPAHALCEIRRSGRFEVVSVGFSAAPVTSMGGLRVVPDVTTAGVAPEEAALFLLPGGDMWEQAQPAGVDALLERIRRARVPVAAICGATLAAARAGLLRDVRHTSNAREYLEAMAPGYGGGARYADELAVRDGGVITASGLGCVEFAREIMAELELYDAAVIDGWYAAFKHGRLPQAAA